MVRERLSFFVNFLHEFIQVEYRILEGHEDEVWSLCFSPDGKLLATASADGKSYGIVFLS